MSKMGVQGMNKKQIAQQTQEKVCEVYEQWKSGEITFKDYTEYLVNLLENYIKYRIEVMHRLVGAEYEDLMQAGYYAIVAQARAYNPYQTKPSSYFTQYIDQYQKDILKNGALSKHYVSSAAKMEKVAKQYGYTGLADPNLEPDKLAILSELPLKTVIETIQLKAMNISSLEALSDNDNNLSLHSPYKNPEQSYIEEERSEFLCKQLAKCSPLEQFLLNEMVLSPTAVSSRQMLEILRTPEMQEKYKDELDSKISTITIEQKKAQALRRIRNNQDFAKYVSHINREIDLVPQAEDDDIEDAILTLIDID